MQQHKVRMRVMNRLDPAWSCSGRTPGPDLPDHCAGLGAASFL